MTYLEYLEWLEILDNCEVNESYDDEGNYTLTISGDLK